MVVSGLSALNVGETTTRSSGLTNPSPKKLNNRTTHIPVKPANLTPFPPTHSRKRSRGKKVRKASVKTESVKYHEEFEKYQKRVTKFNRNRKSVTFVAQPTTTAVVADKLGGDSALQTSVHVRYRSFLEQSDFSKKKESFPVSTSLSKKRAGRT